MGAKAALYDLGRVSFFSLTACFVKSFIVDFSRKESCRKSDVDGVVGVDIVTVA